MHYGCTCSSSGSCCSFGVGILMVFESDGWVFRVLVRSLSHESLRHAVLDGVVCQKQQKKLCLIPEGWTLLVRLEG